jgi:hypothetical protein
VDILAPLCSFSGRRVHQCHPVGLVDFLNLNVFTTPFSQPSPPKYLVEIWTDTFNMRLTMEGQSLTIILATKSLGLANVQIRGN